MYHGPTDFARFVHEHLSSQRKEPAVSLRALEAIAEALFSASLHAEEGRGISCDFAYLDPANPDPSPPRRIVRNRWTSCKLAPPLPLTATNIAKLALATDSRTSSLAIHAASDDKPFIWGLVDQANESHAFSVFDSESGAERPGLFHVTIVGPGHIVALDGFVKLLELRGGTVVRSSIAVLSGGPVRAFLQPYINASLTRIRSRVPRHLYDARPHWSDSLTADWLQTLARLLNRIQSHRHGGALLLVQDPPEACLKVKYELSYARIPRALEDGAVSRISATAASDDIHGKYLDSDADHVPMDLYLEEAVEAAGADESKRELDGALWFVSLLSRVDGLVLMRPDLTVLGFGVEVACTDVPPQVVAARNRAATKTAQQAYDHFGTRHRSMMRFCYLVPQSLGFVVSQDGAIRAIARREDRVVIWEDLRLRLEHFAHLPSRSERARDES